MSIVLPLQNNEKCSFPLYPNKRVNDLILDIREEDTLDKLERKIVLTDKEGKRISHETSLLQLVKQPFVISIDELNYSVDPPVANISENILSNQDLRDIALQSYHQKIRSLLAKENRFFISYSEYLNWCQSSGLSTQQATILSKALHKTGIILHFHENPDFKNVIFLKPEVVTNTLAAVLDIKFQTRDAPELQRQLDKLLPQYLSLNETKLELDRKAESRAKLGMVGAFVLLAAQFFILARMVWVSFNWDIMEPVTYFVGLFTLMGGYSFFVLCGEDYTYKALEYRLRLRVLRYYYISKEFNWKKWNDLHQQVEVLRKLLGGIPLSDLTKITNRLGHERQNTKS